MRGLRLDDPQCYYAQTLNIVSIESKALDLWRSNPRFDLFLAGAALELPSHERSHINDLASPGDSGDGGTRVMESAIRMTLAKRGLSKAEIDQTLGEIVAASGGDTWDAYEKEIARFEDTYLACSFSGSRQAIEYVFVRDDRSCAPLALEELSQYAFDNGDQQSYARYQREITLSCELGVRRMELIQELPLTLAAYGYTRFLSDPQATTKDAKSQESRATLRSFDPVDDKIPIYTARNTTEAFFFELDPAVVAAFVCLNAHMPLPNIARNDVPAWKAWILHNCSQLLTIGEAHFILTEWERVRERQIDIAPALAFGALHSLAHAFKNTAHKFVGIDGDGLAEYLFPAFGSGLIYASANVQFTLGGIDAVFKSNMTQWLLAVRDYAGLCSFDPVCAENGGACHACMYPKFGCQFFNRTVSRAFLIGGKLPGLSYPLQGLWSREVQEQLAELPTLAVA